MAMDKLIIGKQRRGYGRNLEYREPVTLTKEGQKKILEEELKELEEEKKEIEKKLKELE